MVERQQNSVQNWNVKNFPFPVYVQPVNKRFSINMTKWDKEIQSLERKIRQLNRDKLQLRKENESLKRRERSLLQDIESLNQAIDRFSGSD